MDTKSIRVASVQFNHKPGDKNFNLARIKSFAEDAVRKQVQIIAFPEMCITGYWHVRKLGKSKIMDLAEKIPAGESCRFLFDLAKKHNMMIGAGLIEQSERGELFNAYLVCLPDGRFAKHRKLHTFISEHMSSGHEYTVFDTHLGVKIGVLICYDNNILENVRMTALKGADILLAPHQTGGCTSASPHAMSRIDPQLWLNRKINPAAIENEFKGPKGREWLMRWLPSRAHDNGLFIVFSNGVGLDDDEVRTGNAMIIDPYGRIIVETCKADDGMVIADLDLNLLKMCTGRRWMRARRPELYGLLTEKTGNELDMRTVRFGRQLEH